MRRAFRDIPYRLFEHALIILFGLDLIAAILAFAFAYQSPGAAEHLARVGNFVSGIPAILGTMLGAFAIYTYVRAGDIRYKAAGRAWTAKLCLEEAIHA